MDKELKSLSETAELLGRTRQRIHQLYKAGKFPGALMIGETIAIPLSDINNLKQNHIKREI